MSNTNVSKTFARGGGISVVLAASARRPLCSGMWYGWTGRNGRHGHGHTKYIAVVLSLHLTSYILHLGHDEVQTG